MSDLEEAVKSLVQLGKLLEPIIIAAPVLEKIGSLEKRQAALESDVARVQRQYQQAHASLDGILSADQQAKAEHEQRKQTMRADLDRLREDAEKSAAVTLDAAEQNAAYIIADARKTAADIKNAADQSVAAAALERDRVHNEKVALDKEIAEKKQQAAKIKQTIEGFRAAL